MTLRLTPPLSLRMILPPPNKKNKDVTPHTTTVTQNDSSGHPLKSYIETIIIVRPGQHQVEHAGAIRSSISHTNSRTTSL